MNATSCNLTVLRQETVAEDIMRLTVQWQDRSREPHAGQFYMLRAWAADATPILSRPISVDDFDNQTGALTFLYQVKGEGTHKLAALKKDDTLTVTGPCGNGFDTAALAGQYKRIAVVGGGIGTAAVGWLLKLGGFVGTATVQSESAIRMIFNLYITFPFILGIVITVLLAFLDVEKANKKWDADHAQKEAQA